MSRKLLELRPVVWRAVPHAQRDLLCYPNERPRRVRDARPRAGDDGHRRLAHLSVRDATPRGREHSFLVQSPLAPSMYTPASSC